TPSGVVRAGNGAPDNADLRLGRKHGVEGLRPQSAGKRDAETATAYIRNGLDVQSRSVSGDAHIGRRMDADIGEALRKDRPRWQELGLPGLGDRVDNDKGAKA